MTFTRFVEIGRVAFINFGEDAGKLCVILDVVNRTTVLVQGPCTGVSRQLLSLKRIALTDIKIKIGRACGSGPLTKAFNEQKVIESWEKTSVAKKLALKVKRSNMTDYDRFKSMVEKKKAKLGK